MRTLVILLIALLYSVSCNQRAGQNLTNSSNKTEFTVVKIDSTENSYFLDCKLKSDNRDFVLVSLKGEKNNCKKITINETYKINIDFQSIMAGDYGGYSIFGKEFPIETLIAFTNDLEGLCLTKKE